MSQTSPGAVVLLVAGLAVVSDAEPARFDNDSLVRVLARTPQEFGRLEKLGVTVLSCQHGPGRVDVAANAEQIAAMTRFGLPHAVIHESLQEAIEAERATPNEGTGEPDPYADFFLDYHPYDNGEGSIVWFMSELAARHPALVSTFEVGTTLEGRTVRGVKVTAATDPNTPAVVYFGAEHAREWISTTVPTYLALHLAENYGSDSEITDLLDHVEFYLVPVFNVDGYEYTWTDDRLWRKNRRGGYGVDLNRNWGEGWGGPGSSGNTADPTYRGDAPFSEPETAALRDFITSHPNLRAQLDLHTYSRMILWPFGYTPDLPPDHDYYLQIGATMQTLIEDVHGTAFNIGPAYTTIYPASGASIDWTYVHRDMLSMAFECEFGFLTPAGAIIAKNEELLPAILHLANSQWVRDAARFEFPGGLPRTLLPGQPTTFTIEIIPQTAPLAIGTAAMVYRYDPAAAFTSAALAPLGGSFYAATLPPTNCTSQPEFYFSVETADGTEVTHPSKAPAATHKAMMQAGRSPFLFNDLSANPGWTTEGQWQWGQPTGGGGEVGPSDPTSGFTGAQVYGYNLAGDYPNSLPERRLTTPAFNCSGRKDVRLDFRRWLGVESRLWDRAGIEASVDGAAWTKVWRNSGEVADSSWSLHSIDLSAIADDQPAVYIRWTMGPTDSFARYCGWNIDDVTLTEGVCEGLFADFDGDSDVDDMDLDAFAGCFGGAGIPAGPGCAVFDSEPDGDVDCNDWVELHAGWTAPGGGPGSFEACQDRAGPEVAAAGSRYFSVTPPPGIEPVSLRVTSPEYPCFVGYVDVVQLPNLALVGRVFADPVFRTPQAWETVHVGDRAVSAFTRYRVRTETIDGTASISPEAQTFLWGDTTDPIGAVNVLDISGISDRLKGLSTAPPLTRCDLNPAVPNYEISVLDLASAADAVAGRLYPYPPPANCP